jgi:hypothetical protein
MKFLGDESVDGPIIHTLRTKEYKIDYIKKFLPV